MKGLVVIISSVSYRKIPLLFLSYHIGQKPHNTNCHKISCPIVLQMGFVFLSSQFVTVTSTFVILLFNILPHLHDLCRPVFCYFFNKVVNSWSKVAKLLVQMNWIREETSHNSVNHLFRFPKSFAYSISISVVDFFSFFNISYAACCLNSISFLSITNKVENTWISYLFFYSKPLFLFLVTMFTTFSANMH